MSPGYDALKKRYADGIIRQINENPQAYLTLGASSGQGGSPVKNRPEPVSQFRGRFGPAPQPSETQEAFAAGFQDGWTFGTKDEIGAGWAAIPAWFNDRDAGEVYDDELARVRAKDAYLQQQHPVAYGAGAVAGSLTQPVSYMPIGWVGRGAAVASKAGPAARLLANSVNMAKVGAINGGVYGFNSGTGGLANRLGSAEQHAALGAAMGAGLPVLAAGASRGAQAAAAGAKLAAREAEVAATAAAAAVMRHPRELPALLTLARKIIDDGGGTIDLAQRLRNNLELLSRRGESAIANEIGILRDARTGKGDFGLGTADAETSQRLAEAFLGPQVHRSTNGYVVVADDLLRQYRPPRTKYNPFSSTGVQANFESRWKPVDEWQSNGHLDIIPRKRR